MMLKIIYEFEAKKIKKYKFVIALLLTTAVAAYSATLDISDPPQDPIYVNVPGPVEYIHVPGPIPDPVECPEPIVCDECTDPIICDKCPPVVIPGECDSIWNHFHAPVEKEIPWWEGGNGYDRSEGPTNDDPDPGPGPGPDPGCGGGYGHGHR